MPQSLAQNIIHLIYSTKSRKACLSASHRERLYAYQAGIFDEWESPALTIGGTADHVHALFVLSKNHALSKLVEEVKKSSSKWLKTSDENLTSFHWQNGYGAFSVSQSNVARVRRYIADQDEHHRKVSFQEEFLAFLKKHGVAYDARYVWD